MAEHGDICWNELTTKDLGGAKNFYSSLLGWEIQEVPMPDGNGQYIICKRGDKMVCGMMAADQSGQMSPTMWMPYFQVDNLQESIVQVSALGGNIIFGPHTIAGVGDIAIATDNAGAILGLMQPTD